MLHPTINHATTQKEDVMHLICVQLRGSLGMETSVRFYNNAPRQTCMHCYKKQTELFVPNTSITYYSSALLFPISFRGFWLNAK